MNETTKPEWESPALTELGDLETLTAAGATGVFDGTTGLNPSI